MGDDKPPTKQRRCGHSAEEEADVYNLSDLLQMVNKLMYEKDPDTAKAEWLRMGKRGRVHRR